MQTFSQAVTNDAWTQVTGGAVTGDLTVVNQTNGRMRMVIAASAPALTTTDYVFLYEPWSATLAGENVYVRMDDGEKPGRVRGIKP
jgi:hypothetical protein